MPTLAILSNGPSVDLAVVADADLDRGRRGPAASIRSRASWACDSESVTPTPCTPWCSAAWMSSEPQPQPMSSRRSPGGEPELAADQLELALLGGLERLVRVVEVGARVDEARAEQQLVEAVGDVVVMADRGPVAPERVQAARPLRLDRRHRRPQQDARSGDPHGGGDEPRALAGAQAERAELAAQAQHGLEVASSTASAPVTHARESPIWLGACRRCAIALSVADLDDRRVRSGRRRGCCHPRSGA